MPLYNSNKLYKFGLNNQANQKYQYKQCKCQFALRTDNRLPTFKLKADKFKEYLNLQSDDWYVDETVVFTNGEKHYL